MSDTKKDEFVFISYDEAQTLVDRIAERTKDFNHEMTDNEKEAMSELLSDIGVKVIDLIDVSYLADNYAINAEIVTPSDVDNYSRSSLQDALFSWKEEDGTYYCLRW